MADDNGAVEAASSGAARRRREQKKKKKANRHVSWLTGLVQAASAHHTGANSAPRVSRGCEGLVERVFALEKLVATLVGEAPATSAKPTVNADLLHRQAKEAEPWLVHTNPPSPPPTPHRRGEDHH